MKRIRTKYPIRKKGPGGRPTLYKDEYTEQAYKLCLLGATDKEIADIFGVTETSLNGWKSKYPEFFKSLKKGKKEADAVVAQKLYHRAKGYTHPEEKIFNNNGEILRAETLKHHPPDTTAAIFWLKNRQPALWRDQKAIEHTGKDGGPMQVEHEDKTLRELLKGNGGEFISVVRRATFKGEESTGGSGSIELDSPLQENRLKALQD